MSVAFTNPNAEVCVHCGGEAHAVVGRDGPHRVTGWYGSRIADMRTMYAFDTVPDGPICDVCLQAAIDAGRVVDPEPILSGELPLDQVPDTVVALLIEAGAACAAMLLQENREHRFPVHREWWPGHDDPLAFPFEDNLSGKGRPGTDLVGIGRLMALVAAARGREFGPETRTSAIADYVVRLRDAERSHAEATAELANLTMEHLR